MKVTDQEKADFVAIQMARTGNEVLDHLELPHLVFVIVAHPGGATILCSNPDAPPEAFEEAARALVTKSREKARVVSVKEPHNPQ